VTVGDGFLIAAHRRLPMTTVSSPVNGRIVGLDVVPDPVFSGAMVGPGIAVDPTREPGDAVSPVDGVLVSLHPHAFVVVDGEGRGVLTHLGVDTVQLDGRGFELLAAKGDDVTRGQPVVRWDPAAVEASGKSPLCPVIALEATAGALLGLVEGVDVRAGDILFDWK
jgi:PTS system N-acetylglucosamine-specific IIA component